MKILVWVCVVGVILLADEGKMLFEKHCVACHTPFIPMSKLKENFLDHNNTLLNLKAPTLNQLSYRLKQQVGDRHGDEDLHRMEVTTFMSDYVIHPDKDKSVCLDDVMQHFETMPSLKGKVSEQDLKTIAAYVMEKFPSPSFVKMITEIQRNDKMNGLLNSPFLINKEALPHMTKILIQNWDKATLGLSDEQKQKLLVVRKNTMGAIRKIKKQLAPLEAAIIEAAVDGEVSESIDAKVDEVAKLKAQATKVHIKCIVDTVEILNDEQMEILFPFFDA